MADRVFFGDPERCLTLFRLPRAPEMDGRVRELLKRDAS